MSKLTFNSVRKTLMACGVTIRANDWNEYRVALKGEAGDGYLIERGHTKEEQQWALNEALEYGQRIGAIAVQPVAEPAVYRLGSSPLVHAPGIVRMVQNEYRFANRRQWCLKILRETWNLPQMAAVAVASGLGRVDGEVYVIEA